MKIIAFYLPQFHEIPENNQWWGEGFTEWTNVKKATSLFPGHNQPRVPLHNRYYDLLSDEVKLWQVNLAKEYGVYGFCFYHYWFNGKLLLEKPIEQFLKNKSLDCHFCISWANEHWTNAWSGGSTKVLISQQYGSQEEWEAHFQYLLPFLKDKRYIKENNRPLFIIYRPELIDCLEKMLTYWNQRAIEEGFAGLEFAYQQIGFEFSSKYKYDYLFKYAIEYQPNWAQVLKSCERFRLIQTVKKRIVGFVENRLGINLRETSRGSRSLKFYNYDDVWENIIHMKPRGEKHIPGAFVDWDNTPRRGYKGSVFIGASPVKFQQYIKMQINNARENYKKDMLFVFAWNEWAEGGYLEPDTKYGLAYLQAIKNALLELGEIEAE